MSAKANRVIMARFRLSIGLTVSWGTGKIGCVVLLLSAAAAAVAAAAVTATALGSLEVIWSIPARVSRQRLCEPLNGLHRFFLCFFLSDPRHCMAVCGAGKRALRSVMTASKPAGRFQFAYIFWGKK